MTKLSEIKKVASVVLNNFEMGWSHHSKSFVPMVIATTLGAEFIEFHLDLEDKCGREWASGHCLVPDEFLIAKTLVKTTEACFQNREGDDWTDLRLNRADPYDNRRPFRERRDK